MTAMESLFPITLDTPVAETPVPPGFDIRPLVTRYGKDVTWRRVFKADPDEISAIPGYGSKTERKIRRFISENIPYTFEEFLKD